MNHKGNGPKLDLKLNLSPPWPYPQVQLVSSPNRSVSSMEMSPPSSCVSSSEVSPDRHRCLRYPSSPEVKSMMLVGCPQCLMYVMLSEEDPRCPKCKSTVLLEIIHEEFPNKKTQK